MRYNAVAMQWNAIAMECDCVRNAIALFGNPPPSTVCSRPRVRREESARRGGGEVVLPSWAGTTQCHAGGGKYAIVMQCDCNAMRLQCNVMQCDCNAMLCHFNAMRLQCNGEGAIGRLMQCGCNAMRCDCNGTQCDCTLWQSSSLLLRFPPSLLGKKG